MLQTSQERKMNLQNANIISKDDLLKSAINLGLLGALVYAAGWTFTYEYFHRYQLGLLGIEIPLEYFFVYGYWVFLDWWKVLFFIVALTLLTYFLIIPRFTLPVLVKRGLFFTLAFLLFVGVAYMARQTADRYFLDQQDHNFSAYPQARVWLKSAQGEDQLLEILKSKLSKGCHRLFLQNKDKLYLFLPSDLELVMVELSMAEVRALRVFPPSAMPNCDT